MVTELYLIRSQPVSTVQVDYESFQLIGAMISNGNKYLIVSVYLVYEWVFCFSLSLLLIVATCTRPTN
jgi:hypothetical protein